MYYRELSRQGHSYCSSIKPLTSPTVGAESSGAVVFGTTVSDIQTGVTVSGNAISGSLKYLDSGDIASYWGAGHFLVLKFTNIDTRATSVKVGLDPSQSSGLVEIIDDPDKNGVFKITNKDTQVFKVVSTGAGLTKTDTYSLTGLTILYTQAELEAMTVQQIQAIATERGYTITQTLKADIITEFLAQQNA